jgi:molybdopterin-guanine dinucleotide biosynthesis protein A
MAAITTPVDRQPTEHFCFEEHVAWILGGARTTAATPATSPMTAGPRGWARKSCSGRWCSVLEAPRPQVGEILINANQRRRVRRARASRDPGRDPRFRRPAGRAVALTHAAHLTVATVPCDSPFLPADLVSRLSAALDAGAAELAVARTFDQPHPVFALVRKRVLPHLTRFLEGGGRKIDAWYATLATVEVAFDDEADAFRNINTLDELSKPPPGLSYAARSEGPLARDRARRVGAAPADR